MGKEKFLSFFKDCTSSDQISLPLWNLSQILMVITMMLEKVLCAILDISGPCQ